MVHLQFSDQKNTCSGFMCSCSFTAFARAAPASFCIPLLAMQHCLASDSRVEVVGGSQPKCMQNTCVFGSSDRLGGSGGPKPTLWGVGVGGGQPWCKGGSRAIPKIPCFLRRDPQEAPNGPQEAFL